MKNAALLVPLLAAAVGYAQQILCAPSVAPAACHQFDAVFGSKSMWPSVNFTKNVEIAIVDPAGFRAERQRLDTQKDRLGKAAKTPGDLNRVANMEAADGLFDHEILETNRTFVTKIVISTEAVDNSGLFDPCVGDQLFFYVIGYDQGQMAGVASTVP